MTTKRRTINVDKDGENKHVSIKIPENILNAIDERVKKDFEKYTSRTDFIVTSARYYLNLIECPSCKHLNPNDAILCSYCGTGLKVYLEEIKEIQSISNEIEKKIGLMDDYLTKALDLQVKINKMYDLDSRKKTHELTKETLSILNMQNAKIEHTKIFLNEYNTYQPKNDNMYDATLQNEEEWRVRKIKTSARELKITLLTVNKCETLSNENRKELRNTLIKKAAIVSIYTSGMENVVSQFEFHYKVIIYLHKNSIQ